MSARHLALFANRIGQPSLDLNFTAGLLDSRIAFTRASGGTYFDAAAVMQLAATDVPRFDYDPASLAPRGLLIEESRKNWTRNNANGGASVGTPGVLPTNWAVQSAISLVTDVAALGTDAGIPYIDLHISGTAAAGSYRLCFETTSGIPGTNTQPWTTSQYCKLTAGSLANITSFSAGYLTFTITPTLIGSRENVVTSPTGAALATQRIVSTWTNADATSAYVRPSLAFATPGGAIDLTLRIGMQQMEQAPFATSAIATAGAAATRAVDVATMPVGVWFNAAQDTLAVDAMIPAGITASSATVVSLDDGTGNNRAQFNALTTGTLLKSVLASGGVASVVNQESNAIVIGTPFKAALAVAAGLYQTSYNGGNLLTRTASIVVPAGVTRLALGVPIAGNNTLNGYLSRVRYWPRALSAAQLQQVTR